MDIREWQNRVNVFITVAGLLLLSFIGRLYQKTVIEHSRSVREAENQYALRKEIAGARGEIVVNSGAGPYPLATNERRYQVLVVPKNVQDARSVARHLATILNLPEGEILAKIDNDKLYIPPLASRLSREQADRIAALRLPGILPPLPELVRTYPEKSLAAHLIGFVNYEGKGNYGLEGTYDFALRGAQGYRIGQKDIQGRLIRLGDEVQAKDGARLNLTLEREIQHFATTALAQAVKKFEAEGGTVIVINPKTGALIALANEPSFDPNGFNAVEPDDQGVFLNQATAAVWEPGSVIKPINMALAIDHGLVEPETQETFGSSVQVGNHTIYTAQKKAFGLETMTQVLENSDNVGMVWVVNKLGSERHWEGLKKFGFGVEPDFHLQGMISGSLPPLKDWRDLTRATIAFGQGLSSTPLQLAMAFAALANQGVMMAPYVVASVEDNQGVLQETKPKEIGRVVSPETSQKLTAMLESVVVNGHGKRAAVAGYRIGGKTGTAQVPKPEGGYYDDRHIGTFAGFFPLSDPQYVVLVKLNYPKAVQFAESSAAPTFGEIASWILRYKGIPPDKQ